MPVLLWEAVALSRFPYGDTAAAYKMLQEKKEDALVVLLEWPEGR